MRELDSHLLEWRQISLKIPVKIISLTEKWIHGSKALFIGEAQQGTLTYLKISEKWCLDKLLKQRIQYFQIYTVYSLIITATIFHYPTILLNIRYKQMKENLEYYHLKISYKDQLSQMLQANWSQHNHCGARI